MFFNRKKPVQAKLIGTTLVAAFHTSNPNLIWKFDLERNHSFTLALQGEEGDLELGVTSPKGEFYPVARFAAREDAEEAFLAVQKILMKRRGGRLRGWLSWIGGFAVFAFVIFLISHYVGGSSAPRSSALTPNNLPQGVPVPADQVLRPPP